MLIQSRCECVCTFITTFIRRMSFWHNSEQALCRLLWVIPAQRLFRSSTKGALLIVAVIGPHMHSCYTRIAYCSWHLKGCFSVFTAAHISRSLWHGFPEGRTVHFFISIERKDLLYKRFTKTLKREQHQRVRGRTWIAAKIFALDVTYIRLSHN